MSKLTKFSYYRFVPGREDCPSEAVYQEIVKSCSQRDVLVQVGVGFGRSTCLMCELLSDERKFPKLYAIDLFGTVTDPEDVCPPPLSPWNDPLGYGFGTSTSTVGVRHLIDHFDFYVASCPAKSHLTDRVQFPPWHSSEEFADESVYFVHLNTKAPLDQVAKQVEKWLPKVRKGGVLLVGASDKRIKE